MWDVGAGSGSVAVEAAQLSEPGMVYAIEQDAADYHLILANAEAFGVRNLKAVHGAAPAVFAGLPAPDAVFVGGLGHEVGRLLEAAWKVLRPGGRMAVNVATLESLNTVYGVLKGLTAAGRGADGERGPRRRAAGDAAFRGGQPDVFAHGGQARERIRSYATC